VELNLNVLFLPLLGGYLLYCTFHGTQYIAGRRPKGVLMFWCAVFGLMLLTVARLLTMLAEWSIDEKIPIGEEVVEFALPPLLYLVLVGLLLHAVTEKVNNGRLLSRPLLWKSIIGSMAALFIIFILVLLTPVANSLANEVGGTERLMRSSWLLIAIALLVISFKLARAVSLPFAVILLRAALVLVGFTAVVGIAFQYIAGVKQCWLYFSKPLGHEIEPEAIGMALLACALGPFLAVGMNFLYPRSVAASRHFESDWINGLEDLIYTAAKKGSMLMLTLTDRKVYIGHVEWVPPHPEAKDAFIQIVPYFSGYRSSKTHELRLVTFYSSLYTTLARPQIERFRKVLPTARIISAAEFDPAHYATFVASRSQRANKGIRALEEDELQGG
jgi:hypothetical protein